MRAENRFMAEPNGMNWWWPEALGRIWKEGSVAGLGRGPATDSQPDKGSGFAGSKPVS